MDAHDFNKDMGRYLREKGAKTVIEKQEEKKTHEDEEVSEKDLEQLEHKIEDDNTEETVEVEEEQVEKKPGFFKRIFSKFTVTESPIEDADVEPEENEEPENIPELNEDVKEVLRNMHEWISKLPSDKMQEFKNSNDFVQYKAVLKKYGMIK